jgi:hypothetical protein
MLVVIAYSTFYETYIPVFREQADWTFILPSEFLAKELLHLTRNMTQRDTTYWEVW